jgi:hypothetical protein
MQREHLRLGLGQLGNEPSQTLASLFRHGKISRRAVVSGEILQLFGFVVRRMPRAVSGTPPHVHRRLYRDPAREVERRALTAKTRQCEVNGHHGFLERVLDVGVRTSEDAADDPQHGRPDRHEERPLGLRVPRS